MTPEEIQSLRDWSAGKMCWTDFGLYYGIKRSPNEPAEIGCTKETTSFGPGWQPDTDLNQAFMLVERMKELGWNLLLHNDTGSTRYRAEFDGVPGNVFARIAYDTNPCLAILLAARATEEK